MSAHLATGRADHELTVEEGADDEGSDRVREQFRVTPVLAVVGVFLFLCGLVLVDQRAVIGQPDENGTVVTAVLTGHAKRCGKGCRCDEARFTVDMEDGQGPGSFTDCEDSWSPGDYLTVRRHRGDGQALFADPVPGWAIPLIGLAADVFLGAAVLCAAGCGAVRDRVVARYRTRQLRT